MGAFNLTGANGQRWTDRAGLVKLILVLTEQKIRT